MWLNWWHLSIINLGIRWRVHEGYDKVVGVAHYINDGNSWDNEVDYNPEEDCWFIGKLHSMYAWC